MKICIIGYSGFLGSYILKKLSKKFFIIKINLREMPEFDDKNFKNFLNKFNKSNIIINCAAALKPRSKRDFFINQDFPKTLSLHMKKRKKKFLFIHMSTINVLIKDRKDSYTISKRIAEKKLLNTNATILRLPSDTTPARFAAKMSIGFQVQKLFVGLSRTISSAPKLVGVKKL